MGKAEGNKRAKTPREDSSGTGLMRTPPAPAPGHSQAEAPVWKFPPPYLELETPLAVTWEWLVSYRQQLIGLSAFHDGSFKKQLSQKPVLQPGSSAAMVRTKHPREFRPPWPMS